MAESKAIVWQNGWPPPLAHHLEYCPTWKMNLPIKKIKKEMKNAHLIIQIFHVRVIDETLETVRFVFLKWIDHCWQKLRIFGCSEIRCPKIEKFIQIVLRERKNDLRKCSLVSFLSGDAISSN